jgi:hypothetical protein
MRQLATALVWRTLVRREKTDHGHVHEHVRVNVDVDVVVHALVVGCCGIGHFADSAAKKIGDRHQLRRPNTGRWTLLTPQLEPVTDFQSALLMPMT